MTDFPRWLYSRSQIIQAIHYLKEKTDHMATQADVDALTAAVGQVATDLASAKTTLQNEIDQLASANPSIDLTALSAAVAPLDQAVNDLAALKPAPPAPGGTLG